MNLRNALIAAAVVAAPLAIAPGAVQAQALNGVYLGAGAGVNWLTETSSNFGGGKVKSDGVGIAGVGSIGYAFGNGLRVELEGNYRYQPIKFATAGLAGYSNTYGPMVNVLYDFDAGLGWATPYVGVGAGYQFGEARIRGVGTNSKGAWAARASSAPPSRSAPCPAWP